MRLTPAFLALLLVPHLAGAQQPTHGSYVPPNGFVPDSTTAVRIAIAVWAPIYGTSTCIVTPERPLSATLDDGVWTVTGGVQCPGYVEIVPGIGIVKGPPIEIAVVKIAKRDGRILYQGRT
jgi:hypothetical protein